MTYTVSSGSLNSTIPYHTIVFIVVMVKKLYCGISPQTVKMTVISWEWGKTEVITAIVVITW